MNYDLGSDQRSSYCPHCKKETYQILETVKKKIVRAKEVEQWICQQCKKEVKP